MDQIQKEIHFRKGEYSEELRQEILSQGISKTKKPKASPALFI